jgi:tripartite-type tricarboxylate transporter receptor subunit TctC
MAPGNTPKAIVQRVFAEAAHAIRDPAIKDRLTALGIEPVGNSPEQAKKFLDAEVAKWAKVVRETGARPE